MHPDNESRLDQIDTGQRLEFSLVPLHCGHRNRTAFTFLGSLAAPAHGAAEPLN
jgi:hypothetical protein